ncbi:MULTISPECIES: NAD-dependent epimerase/dehydratase family protein [unclassified Mesorhizobium]|uniref:NAD-dependent epimerase/dehydratase family protein n=1 Tax=unclassified Mesorhizobium TaxID=325217 RepID=UPI001FF04B61|nr:MULTISPECIES: NAD-dependent epimerase/dehydratase family protein [unclassified Mesorhizobium]
MQATTAVTLDASLVLLTGASGWLGGRIAAALTTGLPEAGLLATEGFRVRALVLAGEDVSQLREQGVEIVTGDIRDVQTVRAFVAGTEGALLIHIAGVIHPKKVGQFEAINTQGTINLVEAAQKAGVRRAVIMSSNSPIGCNPHPDHRFTEESPYNPYMSYGRSKMLMEKAVRAEIAAGSLMEIVIVRAPWFYVKANALFQDGEDRQVPHRWIWAEPPLHGLHRQSGAGHPARRSPQKRRRRDLLACGRGVVHYERNY